MWEGQSVGMGSSLEDTASNLVLFLPSPSHSPPHLSLFPFFSPSFPPSVPETSRLCHSPLVLEGIESVYFRGPSFMGERVSLQSSVNKVFSTRR